LKRLGSADLPGCEIRQAEVAGDQLVGLGKLHQLEQVHINLVIFAESMVPLGPRLDDAGVNAHPLAGLLIGGGTVSR
jgi:hypothetical protein